MARIDITGQRFGLLLVTSFNRGGKNSYWNCKCDCGAEIVVPFPNLRSGNTTKCNAIHHRDGQNLHDLTGQKFERLTVLEVVQKARPRVGKELQLRTLYKCLCECGNETIVDSQNLKTGHTRSCGCLLIDTVSTHGCCTKDIRLYGIWGSMIDRCTSEKCVQYKNYGGRGIIVTKEWFDVEVFFEWALSNGYKDPLTIERINADGNYEPSNCTFIPKSEQNYNKRNSIGLENVKLIREMAKEGIAPISISDKLDIKYNTVLSIIKRINYKNIY